MYFIQLQEVLEILNQAKISNLTGSEASMKYVLSVMTQEINDMSDI